MSFFDIVLLIIIGSFGLFGLWFGLVHTLGSLVGTVLGAYLAFRYYEPVANWLMNVTHWSPNFSKVLIFVIAFFLINRIVGLVFWLIDKVLSLITRLPFINSINRLLGMVFGILEGAIVLGLIFYFISRFPVSDRFMEALAHSEVAPYTVNIASILWPLIPEAIRALQSTVNGLM